jgi:single-strand DNA-binding protein
MGLNRADIIGNLGADPEIKYTTEGRAVCNFSIATTEYFKNSNGEKQDLTEWHRIVAFGRLAEICGEYLEKGSQVYLSGRIQTREYSGKNGERRWSTSIVAQNIQFIGKNGKRKAPGPPPEAYDDTSGRPMTDTEDDIPF